MLPEIDLNEQQNGVERDSTPTPEPTTHFDVRRLVFTASTGKEVKLTGKSVSKFILERFIMQTKPSVPMIEETLLKGTKHETRQLRANPNDPGYVALLAQWQQDQNIAAMRYLFAVCVSGKPDDDFLETHRPFFPDASDTEMKYMWVVDGMTDDDINELYTLLIGASTVTKGGLEDSAKSFRSPD